MGFLDELKYRTELEVSLEQGEEIFYEMAASSIAI